VTKIRFCVNGRTDEREDKILIEAGARGTETEAEEQGRPTKDNFRSLKRHVHTWPNGMLRKSLAWEILGDFVTQLDKCRSMYMYVRKKLKVKLSLCLTN
jgi:hypothetical protein